MYKQEIAARPRDRKVLTLQELTRETFAKLQENDSNGTPIVEVLNILSINKEPGHITYSTLTKKAQEGTLLQFDEKGRPTSTLQNLSSAYAEAIALKALRDNTGREESAIFEPVTQARNAIEPYSSSSNPLLSIPANVSSAILNSFANKTPDILFTVPKIETTVGTTNLRTYGKWGQVVNPKDPTNTKRLLEYKFRDQNLFSPVEVTVSARRDEISKKIEKFEKGYKNPFPRDKSIAYVPVLVMDYDNYKNLSNDVKQELAGRMRQIGGFISLTPGLQRSANKKAIEAATQLTSVMQSRRKESNKNDEQEIGESLINKELHFTGKLKSEENSLFTKAWQGAKTNLKKLLENLSFSSNEKKQETTSMTPKNRLASEVYQEMIDSLKDTASYPEKAGIDILNNSEHLDLMLAMQLAKKDAAYEKLLKQSPNYRSKEPAAAKAWFEKMLENGVSLSKEYYFDSTGSQEIIRSYDNDASRPPEKSNFEKLSDSVQRYNSSYSTDREGLLVAVTTAAIKAGMNPEQVLRQDPKYSANEKGEALVEKTVEKAESAIQAERLRVEQQAQRDSERGHDRGYER